ncbi:hypothetical protein EBU24_03430, partial [bacterium]|nr:hypothetical protein [bacterium]
NVFIIINANETPQKDAETIIPRLTTKLSLEEQHKKEMHHHKATLQEINDTYHEVKKNHTTYKARAAALSDEVKKPIVSYRVKDLHAIAVTYVEKFSILEQYWHGKLQAAQEELHRLEEEYKKNREEKELNNFNN